MRRVVPATLRWCTDDAQSAARYPCVRHPMRRVLPATRVCDTPMRRVLTATRVCDTPMRRVLAPLRVCAIPMRRVLASLRVFDVLNDDTQRGAGYPGGISCPGNPACRTVLSLRPSLHTPRSSSVSSVTGSAAELQQQRR